jgi:Na+-transporting NADH:ubiquinone oxidoreductase subunit NqrB
MRMQNKTFASDPRYFQLLFQALFLSYGIISLGWDRDWVHYAVSICGCLIFNYAAESIRQKKWVPLFGKSLFSVLISAMSLCLLLKTNHWYTSLLAAFLAVISKYIFRVSKKHIFNPSAFGIVATLLITNDAWLSSGQWGNNAIIFFSVITLGTIVVTKVQKLDVSLAFLFTYIALLYWRQHYVLGWPMDYFVHSISNGSLLLFAFFMISDPKTCPDHPAARIIWAMMIASVSFYLSAFKWMNNAPLFMLIAFAPLVVVLDKIFKAPSFEWRLSVMHLNIISKFKNSAMRSFIKKFAAMAIMTAMISHEASAFCGFYVSKADGTLKNKTSQVIIVHDGDRNVITMYNDFKGKIKDFAMVVPVPVVLKKSDIKVIDQSLFNTLNQYSQPRLVQYYDQNPCVNYEYGMLEGKAAGVSLDDVVVTGYNARAKHLGVKVEAKYLVGEYDILILSAKESAGLRTWLTENGYKIPDGTDEVLEPYVKSNLKFFVVKVNEEEKKKLPGNFLRPIQISFSSSKFMLPIRLGMANADGNQDMIVYAFTKKGRIECTNYRTVSLPTGKNIPLFVENNFENFYTNLFQHQWKMEGKSVAMLEYAWDVSPKNFMKCDPCVAAAPSRQDLVQAGVWWLGNSESNGNDDEDYSANVYFTRMHIRYNRNAFPQDLMFQETANKENFQSRYIITHPAIGDFNCEAGKKYLEQLTERRKDELEMLTYLTGKSYNDWDVVAGVEEEKYIPLENRYANIASSVKEKNRKKASTFLYTALGTICLISLARLSKTKK